MTEDQRARDALAAAADLGAFFGTAPVAGPGWTSWARLTDEPDVLDRRLAEVGRGLSAAHGAVPVEPPVVASITHLGLVARLVAPVLGAGLAGRVLPVAPPASVHLRLSGANPLPLAVTGARPVAAGLPEELARAFTLHWLTPAIAPLGRAVGAASGVSPQVLHGNVVSAVAGALRMAAGARPGLAGRAAAVLGDLLHTGPLAGSGGHRDDGTFVRRSCCLFYRLPGAGTCGDCVLRER